MEPVPAEGRKVFDWHLFDCDRLCYGVYGSYYMSDWIYIFHCISSCLHDTLLVFTDNDHLRTELRPPSKNVSERRQIIDTLLSRVSQFEERYETVLLILGYTRERERGGEKASLASNKINHTWLNTSSTRRRVRKKKTEHQFSLENEWVRVIISLMLLPLLLSVSSF